MNWLKVKSWLFAILFATSVGGVAFATVPQQVLAKDCNDAHFLTMPAWYRGLMDGNCEFKAKTGPTGISDTIQIIVLNVIEIALNIVGYASVGFIIYGGYLYMIGAGAADKIVSARKTILNAVIGLVISFFSVVIVNVVASRIN